MRDVVAAVIIDVWECSVEVWCLFGCNKRKKRKLEQEAEAGRSDSEGSEDEESQIERKYVRTFLS